MISLLFAKLVKREPINHNYMESFIIANGIPVHISETGKGDKTLFFLHGFLETLYVWEEFIQKISGNYRIVTIDLPGHGLSGTHEDSNTLEFMSKVLIDIFNRLSIKSSTIIGHSMGGYLAIEFAKMFPAKIDSLILLNSTPFADSPEKISDREREVELIKAGKLLAIASVSLPKMFAIHNIGKFQPIIDELLEIAEVHDSEGIIASIKGLMQREDNFLFLKSFEKPVYFIFGQNDRFIPEDKANYVLAELVGKKGVIIENAGHICFVEEQKITLGLVVEFLNQLP